VTIGDDINGVDDIRQSGVVPHVLPKFTTYEVSVPVPAVIFPKLSDRRQTGYRSRR
jgi:hypothetical protein